MIFNHKKKMKILFFLLLFNIILVGHSKKTISSSDIPSKKNLEQNNLRRPELPNYMNNNNSNSINIPLLNKDKNKKENYITNPASIMINRFIYSGNNVFSEAQLNNISKSYLNRLITFEDLMELREKITLFYISNGYINSGVILPDQKILDGTVKYIIIEGKLSDINISGNKYLRSSYIKQKLKSGTQAPLNVNNLQKQFQLFLQEPLIKQAKAELKPGVRLGEGLLDLQITEHLPYHLTLSYNNHHSPVTDENTIEFEAIHKCLTGWADTLKIQYEETKGLNSVSSYYAFPISAKGMSLKLSYSASKSEILEYPFNIIDIDNKSTNYGISFNYPVFKTLSNSLTLSIKAEKKQSKTYLFNHPFSFSKGPQKGESNVSVIRFSQEWTSRTMIDAIAINSVLSVGLDACGSTINEHNSIPDSRFVSWLGQFQWAKIVSKKWEIQTILRTDIQFSNKPLLSIEKISIGGANTVRGYRENQLQSDNGIISSIEGRIPLFEIAIPGSNKSSTDRLLYLVPFVDFAWTDNNKQSSPEPDTIASIGSGLIWSPFSGGYAQIFWGSMLKKIDNLDNGLQDSGVHFLFKYDINHYWR